MSKTTPDDLETLADRVRRLERKNRWTRLMVALMVWLSGATAVFSGLVLVAPYSEAVRLPVPYLYRALGHAGGREATAFLIETARTGPSRARVVAIAALGLVLDDDGEVERALTTLSADADSTVRNAARYVMSERKPRSGKR